MTTKLDSSTPIQPTLWKDRALASVAAVPLTLRLIFASPVDVRPNTMPSSATPHVEEVWRQGETGLSLVMKGNGAAMSANVATSNLPSGFEYRDEHAISRFLQENQFLVDILRDAPAYITATFGEDSSAILAVFSDPSEDAADKLTLRIRAHMSVDEAFERLDRLYDEWWLSVLPDMRHKMSIALVPV